MLSKGQKINDRYEIIKNIGEGGMANVYLAQDTILDRKVAVKVLRGDLASDDKFIRRFQREALSVSNLSHPNIVEVYDVGEENGSHYIVMEYIEGKTLKQLLKKRESLTLTEVIDIMTQLTDGISHAHESYIIHRDIKPQNIMIEDDGRIKITDFGIAMALNATQLTQTNSVMGSVHYLPPEQASGKGATIKSDIYSLGILMYELLTGNVPFKGDNAVEIALKHMKDKIPSIRKQDPSIPQSVENIILKACAKNPRNRFDTAKEMHEELVHCLDEEHANDKKIVFEYPENDLDSTVPIPTVTSKKKITKPEKEKAAEDTDELVKEIKPEDIEKDEDDDEEFFEEPKRKNTLITILAIFFLLLLITGAVFWLITTREVKDVTVPNVVGSTTEEAIEKLTKAGFTYTTEQKNSDEVEEGYVIKTTPKAGSTRKKGDTITIVESIGGTYHYLEDYTGKNYTEVKAKLELFKINVLIEKKDVEDKEKYKGKENIIIDQNPKFDKDAEEKTKIEEGDSITLYIPNIVNEYPDMVEEGWSLSDTLAFTKEYKLNILVVDSNSTTIPVDKYNDFSNSKIIEQSRPKGDAIIEGITIKVKINATYEKPKTDNETSQTPNDQTPTNEGRIIKNISNDYAINNNGKLYTCKPRGKFRLNNQIPLVGDIVEFDEINNYILKIEPRNNELIRPSIANVDIAVIVTSVKNPNFDTNLLDKSLTIISYNNITPVIYFTKLDLLTKEELKDIDEYIEYYKKIGYYVAKTKEELMAIIKDKTVVFTGQSGAGKSTLLNKINPELALKTDEISLALGRGKHTTRHTELYHINNTYIADTPGFSKLDFIGMNPIDIRDNMKEMFDNLDNCKYDDCMHVNEDGCYIKKLVEKKEILESRYNNYRNFINR